MFLYYSYEFYCPAARRGSSATQCFNEVSKCPQQHWCCDSWHHANVCRLARQLRVEFLWRTNKLFEWSRALDEGLSWCCPYNRRVSGFLRLPWRRKGISSICGLNHSKGRPSWNGCKKVWGVSSANHLRCAPNETQSSCLNQFQQFYYFIVVTQNAHFLQSHHRFRSCATRLLRDRKI